MAPKVHPRISTITINPKELREIQKIHELGRKYWPKVDLLRYQQEEKQTDVQVWRYYFRHPWLRILTSYLVVFCNFFIFAEDPVSHSYTECTIDYIGDVYTFIFTRWPGGSFVLIKLGTWLFAIALGILIGKFIVHKWFFCHKLKLKIFTEDGQGSWMVIFLTCLMSLYIFSFAYNGFLMLEGKYMDKLHASSRMGMENQTFMKYAAMGTWLGDFITAWMVTDMMLQGLKYADWVKGVRAFWNKGLNRVYAFWLVAISMTVVVSTAISTDYLDWDRISRDFMPTNELSRAFLASFILVMDLLIVMQDWEFPHFAGALDVKLPGVNTDSIDISLPSCCGREPLDIYITGKWFNYGIIFIVMILDLNMWKNQIFYDPLTYGQYTDSEGYIYSVADKQFLRWANTSMMTYNWRWNHINPKTNRTFGSDDHKMNSRYHGYSLGLKGIAFVPSLFTFCAFGYLLWLFGREESGDEALIRRYRRDVRRERRLKRMRRKKRREDRLKRKKDAENGEGTFPSLHDGSSAKPKRHEQDGFDPFFLDEDEPQEDQDKPEDSEQTKKPKRGLKYCLRHPYLRILTSYLVVFCNFLIFAEDPVSHSYTDCVIDIIGNIYAFIGARYPPDAGFCVLKVFMFIVAAVTGMIVGKFFVHKFLFCRFFKLKMFSEEGQGSWMIMFLVVLVFAFIWSFCFNEFLILGGPQFIPYKVSSNMGIENQTFMKYAAMGTWFGDFITAWMVTDMMLQEDQYEWWNRRLRAWWRKGLNRVYAFWGVALTMTVIVCTAITTDYLDWDRISNDFMPTNELSRAFLASFILVMDLLIVMQDWEFPYFAGGMDIKLPGVNTGDFNFRIPGGEVHITGKWFNYGIIFIVMILDLNMWKNQIFYEPFDFGQYVDYAGYIFTVSDRVWLKNATLETLSYAWRWNNTNPLTGKVYGLEDHRMNSRYEGYPLSVKGIAFGPSIAAFVAFGYLAKRFSREENEEKTTVKDFEVVKDEAEEDWDLPEESDQEDGYDDDNRSAVVQRTADRQEQQAEDSRSPSRASSVKDGLPQNRPRRSMADVALMKRTTRGRKQKAKKAASTISLGSQGSGTSSVDLRDRARHVISPLSIDSDDTSGYRGGTTGNGIEFSMEELSTHARDGSDRIRSQASLNSGEEESGDEKDNAHAPQELSFENLQQGETKGADSTSANENWDKIRSSKNLSFGDLFREDSKTIRPVSEASNRSTDNESVMSSVSSSNRQSTRARAALQKRPKPTELNLLQVPKRKGR